MNEEIVDNIPGGAEILDASDLVGADTDRPIADAAPIPESPARSVDRPDDPTEKPSPNISPAGKRRGRPALTPEEKERRAKERANAPSPNFNSPIAVKRDYEAEAMQLFIPVSIFFSKTLGDHWGFKIDEERKRVLLEQDQIQYVKSLALWLEYEKFEPINGRWAFLLATTAYMAPKLKMQPTPERLKKGWMKAYAWIKKLIGKKE